MHHSGSKFAHVFDLDAIRLKVSLETLTALAAHPTDARYAHDRWSDVLVRQQTWIDANALLSWHAQNGKEPIVRVFEHLGRHHDFPARDKERIIDTAERRFFGEPITHSTAGNNTAAFRRLNFWRMVQMAFQGIVPSDLAWVHHCEQAAVDEVKTIMELCQHYGVPSGKSDDPVFNRMRFYARMGKMEHPVITTRMMETVRGWAILYTHRGEDPENVSRWEFNYPYPEPYLSAPKPVHELDCAPDEAAARGYHSIRFWRNYGLQGLSDIVNVENFAQQNSRFLPHVVLTNPQPSGFSSRRKSIEQSNEECMRAFEDMPLPYRKRIPCLVEVMVYGEQFDIQPTGEWLDALETRFFDEVLSSGDVEARVSFWQRLCKIERLWWRNHQQAYTLPEACGINDEPMLQAALGWMLMGHDPSEYCIPVELGRGGLSQPKKEKTDPHAKPLHYWLRHNHWRDPRIQRVHVNIAL